MTKQLTPLIPFGGGVNMNADPTKVGDSEAVEMYNMISYKSGEISKRNGITRYNDVSVCYPSANSGGAHINNEYVKSMYRCRKSDGTEKFLVHAGNRIMIGTDPTYATGTFVAGDTGRAAASQFTYETLADKVIIVSYANGLRKYDFATTFADLGGTPPNAHYCKVHKNYLFLGNCYNGADYPSRIYYSAVGDPETWGANNYISISTNDGDVITGLVSMNGILYVFKDRAIYAVTGDVFDPANGDFAVTCVSDDIGCKFPKSIQLTPSGIIFMAADGVRLFNGNTSVVISDKIKPIVDTIALDYVTYASGYIGCVGGYDSFNNLYYLSYRKIVNVGSYDSDTRHSGCVVFDLNNNNWYPLQNIGAACFCEFKASLDASSFWFGSVYDGFVYRLNTPGVIEDARQEVGIVNFEATETWTGGGVTVNVSGAKVGTLGLVLTSAANGTLTAAHTPHDSNIRVNFYPMTGAILRTSTFTPTFGGDVTNDNIRFNFKVDNYSAGTVTFTIKLTYTYGNPASPTTGTITWTTPAYTNTTAPAGAWQTATMTLESGVVTGSLYNVNLAYINTVTITKAQTANAAQIVNISDVRFIRTTLEHVDAKYKTKMIDFNRPEVNKNFKELYLNTSVRDIEVVTKSYTGIDENIKTLAPRKSSLEPYLYYTGGDSVYRVNKADGTGSTTMCTYGNASYQRRNVCVDDKNIYTDLCVIGAGITIQKYDLDGNYLNAYTCFATTTASRCMEINSEYIMYCSTIDGEGGLIPWVEIIRKSDMTLQTTLTQTDAHQYYGFKTIAADDNLMYINDTIYKSYSASVQAATRFGNIEQISTLGLNGYCPASVIDADSFYYLDVNGILYKVDRTSHFFQNRVLTAFYAVYNAVSNKASLCVDHSYIYAYFYNNNDGTKVVFVYRKSDLGYVTAYVLTNATVYTQNVAIDNISYKTNSKKQPLSYTIWETGNKIGFIFESQILPAPMTLTGFSCSYAPKVVR